MQAALSSVNCRLNSKPSFAKNSIDRFRSRTGRLTKILRSMGSSCYGPMPGSNIGRTSDSPSNPGQYFRCNSMNSVAIRIASAFESVFRIAQPPITSLLSENGPSVTVILPLASRTRTPSLLGSRPPVSTRVPSFNDFSTNLPIASINAGGGGDWRYDSGWRMNVRYFTVPPVILITRRTSVARIDTANIFSAPPDGRPTKAQEIKRLGREAEPSGRLEMRSVRRTPQVPSPFPMTIDAGPEARLVTAGPQCCPH